MDIKGKNENLTLKEHVHVHVYLISLLPFLVNGLGIRRMYANTDLLVFTTELQGYDA